MTDTAESLINPDAIDLDYVPEPRADIVDVELGEELVLIDGGYAHLADPIAALVWRISRVEPTSVRVLAAEFAAEFDASVPVIEADLLEHVTKLGRGGLLAGVAAPIGATAPEGLEPGTVLDRITLPSLDGETVSVPGPQRTLLVNWSPLCGYCVQAAPMLGAAQDALADAGIDIVFLSVGDADLNREVLSDAGLTAPLLLKPEGDVGAFSDPFGGLGTPAAYLLDHNGEITEPMAYGSGNVETFLARFHGAPVEDDAPDGPRFLPGGGGGACAPGAGGASAQTWADTIAVQIGPWTVGVRGNDDATVDVLRGLFAGSTVELDRSAPDNYSVVLGDAESSKLNLLVVGSDQLVRSRSPRRVLDGLLHHLSSLLVEEERPGQRLCTTFAAVDENGQAILLPRDIRNNLKQYQPRLSRAGVRFFDGPVVHLDVSGAQIEIPEITAPHDEEYLATFPTMTDRGSELAPLAAGRYPVKAWGFLYGDGPGLTAAGAASRALGLLLRPEDDPTTSTLRDLYDMFEGPVAPTALWWKSPRDLADQVAHALGH